MSIKKLKIAVYAICKDEESFVDRWMDSMKEADMVVVADTGSTDRTVEKLKSRDACVYDVHINPWRFDVARNTSLNLVPEDMDICVCTDLDEVFEPGWREKLEAVWTPETTRLRYMYTWNFNPDGSRGLTYWFEKIHSRHGYRWVGPVHEVLTYSGEGEEVYACEPAIQSNHFPNLQKSRGQYLPLLELSKRENPLNSSAVFWLGREYMYNRQYDKCMDTLKEHLSLPTATWDQERAASMRCISRCLKARGAASEAKEWLYKAIAECPHTREAYVEMAQLGYELKDWELVLHMMEEALKIKIKPMTYLVEDSSWNWTLYDLGAIACYWLGMYEKSLELAKCAFSMNSGDQRLENNLKLIEEKVGDKIEEA